jgi:ATP/maltotriose-dependent transcriptional regulator MalT
MLDRGRDYPLTWICSPPGSGKTTLAAGYLSARRWPCLWYQVDEGDADPASFFFYLNAALQKALRGKSKPLPFLTAEYANGFPVFTRRFFEILFNRLRPPFPFVFDNFQDVPAQSVFADMIVNGLTVIPAGLRVFILSRTEPPPPFARLRAENKIQFIRWPDLRFTEQESKIFIRQRVKGRLSEEAGRRLHEITEGWAAGLALLADGFAE